MKNSILILALFMGSAAAVLTSCDSPAEKVADAKEDLQKAQEQLAKHRLDSIKTAEWAEFKAISAEKIANNNLQIMELRNKKLTSGSKLDPIYEQRIIELENNNAALQRRIDDHEKYISDWSEFKREFNHDLDEIGKSLKELTVDNAR